MMRCCGEKVPKRKKLAANYKTGLRIRKHYLETETNRLRKEPGYAIINGVLTGSFLISG